MFLKVQLWNPKDLSVGFVIKCADFTNRFISSTRFLEFSQFFILYSLFRPKVSKSLNNYYDFSCYSINNLNIMFAWKHSLVPCIKLRILVCTKSFISWNILAMSVTHIILLIFRMSHYQYIYVAFSNCILVFWAI